MVDVPLPDITTDPVRTMLAYDRWANAKLLDRCAGLDDDALDRDFGVGVGGLRRQLTHIIIVVQIWTDVLNGHEMRADPEDLPWSFARLLDETMAAHDAFDGAAHAGPLDETFPRTYDGTTYAVTRNAIITHVSTHNAHHRAQCLHLLKRLGDTTPMPATLITLLMPP